MNHRTLAAAIACGALLAAPAVATAKPKHRADATPASLAGRVVTLDATVDAASAGVLDTTIDRVASRGDRRVRFALEDQQAIVLVSDTARVTVDGARVTGDARTEALVSVAADDEIEVRAKILSAAKWREDEDGDATPTLRAKQLDLVSDEEPAEDEEPVAEQPVEAPAGETPADEAPAGETPAGEAPAGDAPTVAADFAAGEDQALPDEEAGAGRPASPGEQGRGHGRGRGHGKDKDKGKKKAKA